MVRMRAAGFEEFLEVIDDLFAGAAATAARRLCRRRPCRRPGRFDKNKHVEFLTPSWGMGSLL